MKKLVLTALLCGGLAQLATGCVIVTEEPSTITASWSLVSGDQNAPTDCPACATTIALYSDDNSGGEPFVDLFDCGLGVGTTGDLDPGPYYVWLELQDEAGQVLYAQSRGTDVTVFDEADSTLSFEFSIDRGEFGVSWEILEDGLASDCAAAFASTFELGYTDSLDEFFGPDSFPCTDYSGVTPGIRLDDWTVSPSLIDETNNPISVGDSLGAAIEFGSQYYDLGLITFDLAPVIAP